MPKNTKRTGPFSYPGGPTGILFIHGFTGTAHVFQHMAEFFADEGYTTLAPLLKGHGTTPEEMDQTTAEEWYMSGENAYTELAITCEKIIIIGGSLGGLIATRLAMRPKVAGLVLIGTPVLLEREWLIRFGLFLFPLLRKRYYEKGRTRFGIRYYEKVTQRNADRDEILGGDSHSYNRIPVSSIRQLLKFIAACRKTWFPEVNRPALIIQSQEDGLVNFQSGKILFDAIPSQDKELIWINKPHHRLHEGGQDSEVYDAVSAFIRRYCKA